MPGVRKVRCLGSEGRGELGKELDIDCFCLLQHSKHHERSQEAHEVRPSERAPKL